MAACCARTSVISTATSAWAGLCCGACAGAEETSVMSAQNANRSVGFIDSAMLKSNSRSRKFVSGSTARFSSICGVEIACECVTGPISFTMAAQGMHQSQNLSLQQVLAPQLQQSLLILQAPLLELRNLVQQEMETNPVLEELATDPDSPSTTESAASDQEFKEEFDKLAKLDEEWRDYMAQSGSYSGRSREAKDKRQFFFDSIATQETLQQNLIGQLNQTALNADDRKAAELIIGNIDDNGFLQTTPEEMSLNTGIAKEDFELMLTLIQGFYPPGVG